MGNQSYLDNTLKMKVFVNCADGKQITIDAETDWSVADLKDHIGLRTKIAFVEQNLLYEGKTLNHNMQLADYNIQQDTNIQLLVDVKGGVTSASIDPAIVELSKKYNHDKKICRKCYATLPPRAVKCRKRRCGHWPDIRPRKTIKVK